MVWCGGSEGFVEAPYPTADADRYEKIKILSPVNGLLFHAALSHPERVLNRKSRGTYTLSCHRAIGFLVQRKDDTCSVLRKFYLRDFRAPWQRTNKSFQDDLPILTHQVLSRDMHDEE